MGYPSMMSPSVNHLTNYRKARVYRQLLYILQLIHDISIYEQVALTEKNVQ